MGIPQAPDWMSGAYQQANMGRQNAQAQTVANRPTQINPFGMTTWSQDASGNWTQNTSLNPQRQAALNAQDSTTLGRSQAAFGLNGQLQNNLSQPFSLSGMQNWGSVGDPQRFAQESGDALYNQMTSRLNPMWDQREKSMEAKLAAQGFDPRDSGYQTQMGNFGRDRTDAYQTASNNAITQATNDANRMFNMNVRGAEYANQLRGLQTNEALMQRQLPLREQNALLAGQDIENPTFNSFSASQQAPTPNITGAMNSQYESGADAYNAGQARRSQNMQTAGTVLTAAAMFL